jgi:hypothetical protein
MVNAESTKTEGAIMSELESRRPLEEHEVIVHVPRGSKGHVRIEENDNLPNEITVQVSKKRKATVRPVLGVIVK